VRTVCTEHANIYFATGTCRPACLPSVPCKELGCHAVVQSSGVSFLILFLRRCCHRSPGPTRLGLFCASAKRPRTGPSALWGTGQNVSECSPMRTWRTSNPSSRNHSSPHRCVFTIFVPSAHHKISAVALTETLSVAPIANASERYGRNPRIAKITRIEPRSCRSML